MTTTFDAAEWQRRVAMGLPAIDADHFRILAIIDRLAHSATGDHDGVEHVLSELLDYVGHHFRREEALFQLAGLADGESHIQRHREFERRINELYWSFLHRHSDRVTVGDSTRGDVEALLRQWLIDHVATEDRRYQPLVAGNDAALALMRAWED